MTFNTHYYPTGSYIIKGTEDEERSSIWIETPTELFQLSKMVLHNGPPVEAVADLTRTAEKKVRTVQGVVRYHSLNGDFFAHLTFSTPTDLYVWDLHYKVFTIIVPPQFRNLLNVAEAHILDQQLVTK